MSQQVALTLAIAIKAENIIGAIQCTWGGPKLVQANPNKPIGRSGATGNVSFGGRSRNKY